MRPRPDLWRALASLVEPPSPERAALAEALDLGAPPDAAEHTDLFVLQLPPYASIYLGAEGMMGGEARARIAGFWRAVGREPPGEPDHLAHLLALHASLAEEEAGEDRPGPERARLARHARASLLREHLLCWLPPYLLKLEEVGGPFYRSWAETLGQALADEAGALGAGDGLSAHLTEAPGLEGEDGTDEDKAGTSSDGLADRLLTPVRSGMVLVRSDLLAAARGRGLPLRIGERRFALRAMLSADPGTTLAWLAEEADAWVRRHARWSDVGGRAAAFWRERAERAAGLLRGTAAEIG